MTVNWKLLLTRLALVIMALLPLMLVACGGGGADLEPTAVIDEDPIEVSVRQTMASIAVAQTVAALTTPAVTDPPTPIVLASATLEGLPSPTTNVALPTAAPPAVQPTAAPPTAIPPTAVPPTAVPPTIAPPTVAPPTATATRFFAPPNVENDAPGGSFPEDGSVTFNILVDPTYLFRMDVRDLRAGDFEGAGIESVEFAIFGEGMDYIREERTPGFCVFGGGEPTCNPWPTNEHGQYTWGVGGPVVQSGEYFVNMAVTADEPDDEFFGEWNWNFNFRVTVP